MYLKEMSIIPDYLFVEDFTVISNKLLWYKC